MEYGAHLASVHSENEHDFIKRLIYTQTGYNRPSWLGGYNSHMVSVFELVLNLSQGSVCSVYSLGDSGYSFQIAVLQVPRRWFWTDESPFDFSLWTQGQPDGSGHCLQTNYYGNEIKVLL